MINPTLPQKNLVLQTLHAQYLRSIMTLHSDKHANYWALRKTIERLRAMHGDVHGTVLQQGLFMV